MAGQADNAATAPQVWYFAYGSNMMSSVMTNRGLKPLAARTAMIPSYILTFDVFGVPYSEPAMASIAKNSVSASQDSMPPPVHGVAYLLPREEYLRLTISEGAGIAYRAIELEAEALQSEIDAGDEEMAGRRRKRRKRRKFTVQTLVARYPFRPNAAPSTRYLHRLLQGAEEHNLPPSYQDYLKTLPTFSRDRDLSSRGQFGATVFLYIWPALIGCLMRWIKVRATTRSSGQAPQWMGSLVWALFSVMWMYHDSIHCKIWGRGDGID